MKDTKINIDDIEINADDNDSEKIIADHLPFQDLKHKYFRINIVGNSSTVDIVAPVSEIASFNNFMDCAMFLSLFLSDDTTKNYQRQIFKDHLEKMMNKQKSMEK